MTRKSQGSVRPASPGVLLLAAVLLAIPHEAGAQEVPASQMIFEVRAIASVDDPIIDPFAAPLPAAQPASPPPEELRRELERHEERTGARATDPFEPSDALADGLITLGGLHMQLQQHEEAVVAFARARDILLALHGKDALPLASALRALASAQRNLGLMREADAAQEEALRIDLLAHQDDLRELVPALERIGDWYLQDYDILSPQGFLLGNRRLLDYSAQTRTVTGLVLATRLVDPRETPAYKVQEASSYYLRAINILGLANDLANPLLPELERRYRAALFLWVHSETMLSEPDFYLNRPARGTASRLDLRTSRLTGAPEYRLGQESFERVMGYVGANRARTAGQIASALLEDADWDLLFAQVPEARAKYAEAHAFFADNAAMSAVADYTQPAVPTVLPDFLPPPNSRAKLRLAPAAPLRYAGHANVSFQVADDGHAREVEWLGTGGTITPAIERRLEAYVRNLLFRPRFRDGEVDATPYLLRFYVAYPPQD